MPNHPLPRPSPSLRVHAILMIGGNLILLADSLLTLLLPRSPFDLFGAFCALPFTSVLALVQFLSVFRRKQLAARVMSIACFAVACLLAYGIVANLGELLWSGDRFRRGQLAIFLTMAAIALQTAYVALLNHRWADQLAVPLQGLCPTCGYDLRATPDRCPECGTVPSR